MRYISLLFLLVATCTYAQVGDAVFTVNKKQAVISLQPNIDTLYNCIAYSFVLKGVDVKDIDSISFGQAKVRVDNMLHISNASMFDTVLELYVRKQGVMIEVYRRRFVVRYCADKPLRTKTGAKKQIAKYRYRDISKRNRRRTPSSLTTTTTNRQW
jgi:hypothetical protein